MYLLATRFAFILLFVVFIFIQFQQVWPINVDLKFVEPIQKELKLLGKVSRSWLKELIVAILLLL